MNWLNAALTTVVDTVAPVIQDAVAEEGWNDSMPSLNDDDHDYHGARGRLRDERRRSPAYEEEGDGGGRGRSRGGRGWSPEHGGGEGLDQSRPWEDERVELIARLHEAESALEASSKEWQGTVRQLQEAMIGAERSRDAALATLEALGQEALGLIGPNRAGDLKAKLAQAKAAASPPQRPPPQQQQQQYQTAPSPPLGLQDVVMEVVHAAGLERARLLAGVSECVLDGQPPPQDVDLLLTKLRQKVSTSPSSEKARVASPLPLPEVASPAMEQRCRDLEKECEDLRQQLLEATTTSSKPVAPSPPHQRLSPPPPPPALPSGDEQESARAREQQLVQEKETLQASLITTQQDLSSLRAQGDEMTLLLNAAQQEVVELRSRLAETMNTRQIQGEEVGKIKAACGKLEEENRELKSRLQTLTARHGTAKEAQNRLLVLEGENRELKQQVANLGKQAEDLRRRLEEVDRARKGEEEKARKKEYEVNQLREVVDQCRASIRVKGEELERYKREKEDIARRLEEAEGQVMRLAQETDSHVKSILAAQAQQQDVVGLQSQLADLTERGERREEQMQQQILELHTRLQEAEHSVHDLTAQLAASKADVGLLSRDYEQAETARTNLQKVLEQFQWEKASEIRMLEASHAKAMEAQEEAFATKEQHIRRLYESQVEDAQAEAVAAKESFEVEKIKTRAEADQARKEAHSLKRALDEAITRLQFSNNDTVDRRLLANLVVSYFVRRQSRDVLDVIAKTLGFTDEERVNVGLWSLDPNANKSGGLLGGLFATVTTGFVGSPRKEFHPADAANSTISDMWVQYLLEETDDNPAPDHYEGPPMGGGGLPSPSVGPGPSPRNFT